ncbi:MAG: CPBP family intramembrane glutamic endopeptidase [Candidatus Saccharimonadales bacterium]
MQNIRQIVHDRNVQGIFFFVLSLAIFNIAFILSNGWARLLWSSLGYLSLFAAYKIDGLSLDSIGLGKGTTKPALKYILGIMTLIVFVMLVAFFVNDAAFKDARYNQSFAMALFATLVLLPLKTVLFEELAFRGILPALFLQFKHHHVYATVVSSLLFGLWHVFLATKMGDYLLGGGDLVIQNLFVVVGTFLATAMAGYIFCELRWRSGSLLAPIAAHWTINGMAIILASFAWS